MSSQDFTTAGLIDTIRMLASVPDNEQLNSNDTKLINFLNFEMSNCLVPQLLAVKEEYFVYNYDFVNSIDPITNLWQDTYELPSNSIGMKLRDFVMLVPSGNAIPPLERYVTQISPEDVAGNRFNATFSVSNGLSFYMRGNSVVLYPCPTATQMFRMKFFRAPNFLVSTSECGQILSIDHAHNAVVLNNVPSDWSTTDTVDCIQPVQGFDFTGENIQIISISAPTVVLASVVGLNVGDWVALQGNSPIPQLPVCAHSVLAQAATVKLLESLKDTEGMNLAQEKYTELYKAMEFMITPRIDGEPVKITDSGRGLASFNRIGKGWGGYHS